MLFLKWENETYHMEFHFRYTQASTGILIGILIGIPKAF